MCNTNKILKVNYTFVCEEGKFLTYNIFLQNKVAPKLMGNNNMLGACLNRVFFIQKQALVKGYGTHQIFFARRFLKVFWR